MCRVCWDAVKAAEYLAFLPLRLDQTVFHTENKQRARSAQVIYSFPLIQTDSEIEQEDLGNSGSCEAGTRLA